MHPAFKLKAEIKELREKIKLLEAGVSEVVVINQMENNISLEVSDDLCKRTYVYYFRPGESIPIKVGHKYMVVR